tara:strand:- start:32053 stop:32244 length:192 start_codon:yes stop_codon:yes gene_type:complete
MPARRGEGQRRHLTTQGEVVEDGPARDVGEDGATILVDGEEQVAARVQRQAGNVLAVREWQGV